MKIEIMIKNIFHKKFSVMLSANFETVFLKIDFWHRVYSHLKILITIKL